MSFKQKDIKDSGVLTLRTKGFRNVWISGPGRKPVSGRRRKEGMTFSLTISE
ncbi:hypothetical protein CHS0354_012874, partial [Potamilus streckersoni]